MGTGMRPRLSGNGSMFTGMRPMLSETRKGGTGSIVVIVGKGHRTTRKVTRG